MNAVIDIVVGSIVEQDVEAIVSAANTAMIMGGGVAAAILAEAGAEVEEEAVDQAPVRVGGVVVTGGGNLSVRHIIHVAVVGEVPPDIYECTRNVLERAAELGITSLALPALGTGSAGVRVRESARGMCEAIVGFLSDTDAPLAEVRIVLWDDAHYNAFHKELARAMLRARRGP